MRRRVVIVPLGALALIIAGVSAAVVVVDGRQQEPTAATSPAETVTLGPTTSADLPEGPSGGTMPRQQTAGVLCQAQPASVRALASIVEEVPVVENLRDGLPRLEERLAEIELAAEGQPALDPVVTRLTTVRDLWHTAVEASDRGKPQEAKAALAKAEPEIKALEADLDKAYPAHTKDCRPTQK